MGLNLLFSPLRYWKSCCFAGQHITQYNKMKPDTCGGGSVHGTDICCSVVSMVIPVVIFDDLFLFCFVNCFVLHFVLYK